MTDILWDIGIELKHLKEVVIFLNYMLKKSPTEKLRFAAAAEPGWD